MLVVLVGLSAWRFTRDRDPAPPPGPAVFSGETMGTTYTVKLGTRLDTDEYLAVGERVEASLAGVNASMSTYLPDSELSRFNGEAAPGEPFVVSKPLRTVLDVAVSVAERSDRALDITVGPAVEAWGFGAASDASTRDDKPSLQAHVGWGHIRVDAQGLTRLDDRVRCDVSAIAKGYATDLLAEALEARGHRDYLIEVGGELKGSGTRPDGQPWQVAIEKPVVGARHVQKVIPLDRRAMATSGDYRNFVETGGKRRSHLFDPTTAAPVDHNLAAVTVVHPQGAFADAWATALMVLGPERAPAVAERERLAALFIVREDDGQFKTMETSTFSELTKVEAARPAAPTPTSLQAKEPHP